MKRKLINCIGIGMMIGAAATANAQDGLLAFPGAEGFGRFATGGRGGEIYHVTNLNDSGTGSLRDAVSKSNRIVVFDVAGVINLKSRLVFKNNLTILGQTAPGEGIQVYGNGVSFSNANNIIVRYLRVRMGVNGDSGKDAAGVASGHDMIFDHMSVLWGRDENFSVSSNDKGSGPANVTIQNSIIGQGLQPHSCGGLIQTDNGVTLFRNLYIENATRNPKVKGLNQFVNNVSYNWGKEAAYNMGGDSAGDSWAEISGNYWITGPWKQAAYPLVGGNSNFKYFAEGNWYDSNIDGVLDGHEMSDEEYAKSGGARVNTTDDLVSRGAPKGVPEIAGRMTAPEALEYVLAYGGASLPVRDEVDQYLIDELSSFGSFGTTGGITTEKALPHKGTGKLFGGYKPLDSDGDGIPDEWETANGLDPQDAKDAAAIAENGYANIENYVFSIDAAFPYLKNPTDLKAIKNEKTAITLEWVDNADKSTGFVVESSGDGKSYAEAGRTAAGETTFKVDGLDENKMYYFRVYALGDNGMRSVESPVLQTMTSEPFTPEVSTLVVPAEGSEEKVLDVVLKWKNATKEYFGALTYNVYLGTSADALEEIASDLTETAYKPEGLEANTTYCWRVDAVNNTGVTEGEVWSFKTVQGGTLFYTDFHTTPASFGESEWGTIISGNQADIMKGVKAEVEFDNMVLGTDGGRLVAFGNLSPYPVYSSEDNGASKNAVGFIGKQGKVGNCYIQINDIQGPWKITLYCGNSDKSSQSVKLSTGTDVNGDGVINEDDDLATLKFKSAEKKTYKFTHVYEGTDLCNVRIDRASIENKGINFHDILIEQYVTSTPDAVEEISVEKRPDVEILGDAVTVNGLDGKSGVKVYDLSGRLIHLESPVKGSVGFSLPKGIYIISVDGMIPVKISCVF
ncbi:MAG: fibronectin type III domain-containing protein [Muribaculaceae bacterium]|nr:fibronectin type III domain-containing protein [Muribaculaceae bacterium]